MPYKRRKRFVRKKRYPIRKNRRFSKRRRNNNAGLTRIRMPSLMPDRLQVKLRYADTFSLVSTGVNQRQFSMNGLFDPDLTGVGHQPRGFDQWMSLYARYRVYYAKAFARFMNNSATNGVNVALVMSNDGSPGITTRVDMYEYPYSKATLIPQLGSNNIKILKMGNSLRKILSEDKAGIQDMEYAGTPTANPSIQGYIYTYAEDSVTGANNVNTELDMLIIYYCEFFGRNVPGQS